MRVWVVIGPLKLLTFTPSGENPREENLAHIVRT